MLVGSFNESGARMVELFLVTAHKKDDSSQKRKDIQGVGNTYKPKYLPTSCWGIAEVYAAVAVAFKKPLPKRTYEWKQCLKNSGSEAGLPAAERRVTSRAGASLLAVPWGFWYFTNKSPTIWGQY